MNRMQNLVVSALLVTGLAGCSLVTDFPDSLLEDAGTTELYSLKDNVGDTVTVTLADPLAIIDLTLAAALPEGSFDNAALLEDGTIALTVTNTDSGVAYYLTDGAFVDGPPANPGEWTATVDELATTLTVQFVNDIEGHSINDAATYTATIDVLDNQWFKTENFTVAVSVQ